MAEQWLSAASICLISLLPTNGFVPLEERRVGSVLLRTITSDDGAFTSARLQSIARAFAREASGLSLAVLTISTRESRAALEMPGSTANILFDRRVEMSREALRKQFNTARVTAVHGRALLEVHYKSGRIERRTLGAYPDPLSITAAGLKLRLLHAELLAPSMLPSPLARQGDTLELWLQSDRIPNAEEGQGIVTYIRSLTGLNFLTIHIRRVAWWEASPQTVFPFADPSGLVYANWRQEPWAIIDYSAGKAKYTLLDGIANRTVDLPQGAGGKRLDKQ